MRTNGERIAVVFLRALPDWSRNTAEGKLWADVIKSALVAADKSNERSKEARRFLVSDDMKIICNLIGLNFDFAQETIAKHAKWTA